MLSGVSEVTNEDREVLTEAELTSGWRLACRARANGNMALELAQWEATILADDSTFQFTPRPGLGVAVDLGTTTIVAQLLNLQTGDVLAARPAPNAQAQHGADIMSRVEFGAHPRRPTCPAESCSRTNQLPASGAADGRLH